MRFGIVVSDPEEWTAQAILLAFTRRGVDARFLNFSELAASIQRDLSFSSNGVDLLKLDGLVVRDLGRRGSQDVGFRFEVLRALESMGIPIINSPETIAKAANKFATSYALQHEGVPTPRTIVTTSTDEALRALKEYGRAVSKPLFGYKGRNIMLLTEGDGDKLKNIIGETGLVYLQEFIESARPRDIRAFVVGERVAGAIYRLAPSGQWISNLARGGKAESCLLTDELEDLAVRANRAIGAFYSGVDLLEAPDGLKVIEVNGTPSGRGIFEALGVDVADMIADCILRQ